MKMNLPETLFDIIDASDADGYATFTYDKDYVACCFRDLPKNKTEALREMLESLFDRHRLFTLKLERVKRWVADIEATTTTDAEGNVHLRMNVARFLLLPCERPATELAELRGLFSAMVPFFESHTNERADIQICNNRNRNKAIIGTLSCRMKVSEHKMAQDPVFQGPMDAMIAASPTLQAFLRNAGLALQKIGPWSWSCIDEGNLFGEFQGPWFKAFCKRERPPATTPHVEAEVHDFDI